jgi:arsenate reductase (thioredoxin)
VLFVCLHGSAKSLIAAEHFNRIARERRSMLRAESAGIEPDTMVPMPVVAGLAKDGIDVGDYMPRPVMRERVVAVTHVVSFGCELPNDLQGARVERWDDMPMVSDGFEVAREAIVARVERLLDSLE